MPRFNPLMAAAQRGPMAAPMTAPMAATGAGAGAAFNPMQLLQALRQNPAQALRQAGLNIPADLADPNAIIQHLMNSGQVSQAQYDQARQMAAQFRR